MKRKYIIVFILIIITIGSFLIGDSSGSIISNIEHKIVDVNEGVKIVALGDSLTAGYGLSIEDSYPSILETKLKNLNFDVKVVNEGINGETTRETLSRIKSIQDQRPDIVLLGIGGNDALRLIDIEKTYNNLDSIISSLGSGDNAPVVILLQMKAPITSGVGYVEKFNKMYEELAKKHKILVLPFMTADVFLDKNNKLEDGIHFNRVGYTKIVDLYLTKTMVDVVEKIQGNSN